MKIFGTNSIVITFLLLILFINIGISQEQIQCPCVQSECGDIIASFKLASESTVVCDGYEFEVINNSQINNVSYYIWDWGDESRDSVLTNENRKHTYKIKDEEVCGRSRTTYQICLLAVKKCNGETYSCHSNSSPVTVIHRPQAKILLDKAYENSFCEDVEASFLDNSCNTEDYSWNFGDNTSSTDKNPKHQYTNSGNYQVRLTVRNQCGESTVTAPIRIVKYPDAKVKISSNSSQDSIGVACVGQRITLINQSNEWGSTLWSFPGSDIMTDTSKWKILYEYRHIPGLDTVKTKADSLKYYAAKRAMIATQDTIIFDVLKAGKYTFKLTSKNACETVTWNWTLEVVDAPEIELKDPGTFCEKAVYKPTFNLNKGVVNKYLWSFPGGIPGSYEGQNPPDIIYNSPGTYTISLEVDAPCGKLNFSKNLLIYSKETIDFPQNLLTYCLSADIDTLKASIIGGSWSGTGIIDSSNGIFDPKNAGIGTHKITYTAGPQGCESSGELTITVLPGEDIVIQDTILCIDNGFVKLLANPTNGQWSGHDAVSQDGIFNPDLSGAGVFDVFYSYKNIEGCETNKRMKVTVEELPVLQFHHNAIICREGGLQQLKEILSLLPDNGVYQFFIDNRPITEFINPDDFNTDTIKIQFNFQRNQCIISDSATIIFINKPELTISSDTVLCVDNTTFQLQTNQPGGTWSGAGVNPQSGIITLNNAPEGINEYIYTFAEGTSCEQFKKVTIDIKNPGSVIHVGNDISICEDGNTVYQLSGFSPMNGIWRGVGCTPGGAIDLTLLKRDSAYTYTYEISDQVVQNCIASKSIAFIIHRLPQPAFNVDGTPCIDELLTFTNTTMSIGHTWKFVSSDGVTSNVSPFQHTFTNKGTYSVTLEIEDRNGCKNELTSTYYITEKPIALFDLAQNEGCAPFEIITQNNSLGDDLSFEWTANGQTYHSEHLSNIVLDSITNDSRFIIRLLVSNQCGVVIEDKDVLVHPYPIVDFGVNDLEGCSPLTIRFSNASIGNPEVWQWDLGNGVTSTDSIPPIQTYTTPKDSVSIFQVTCIASNQCGTSQATKNITVFPPDISAFIEKPVLDICQFDTIRLESFSTPGAVLTWKAITPDGRNIGSEGKVAYFPLDTSGTYTVILFASRCGTDTDTIHLQVNPAPQIRLNLPPYICQNDDITFSYESDETGKVLWDFGDGNTSTQSFPIHRYSQPGTYEIILIAYSQVNDCPRTVTKNIQVIGLPVSSFDVSEISGCQPLQVTFNNNSIGASNYYWDFGDSTTHSNENNPTHTYNSSGIFSVILTAFDSYGCFSDTAIFNVQVFPKPKSYFTMTSDTICMNSPIQLTNQSTGAVGYQWVILNENFDSKDVVFTPAQSGVVLANLIAISDLGCRDTFSQRFYVKPLPIASFTTENITGCQPFQLMVKNESEHSEYYAWTIQNQSNGRIYQNSIDKEINTVIDESGDFLVTLEAITGNGCPPDFATVLIQVHPKPKAVITVTKDNICGIPMNVTIKASPQDDHSWILDGIEVSQLAEDLLTFNKVANHQLVYIATSRFNCKDTTLTDFDIYPQPMAKFDVKENNCSDQYIEILNNSKDAYHYIWLLDGQPSFKTEIPELIFSQSGTHRIRLIAIYNELCKDSTLQDVILNIYQTPEPDFEYQSNYDLDIIGEVSFKNLSINYDDLIWDLGDGTISHLEDPVHEYDINREIFVKLIAVNYNGGLFTCIDSIIKPISPEWITTFYAPNALAPEYGDELVSVFKPVGIGMKSYLIRIFSPWGKEVWRSSALDEGQPIEFWNGTMNGEQVPQGAYSWIAEIVFVNGQSKVYKGSVTVLR